MDTGNERVAGKRSLVVGTAVLACLFAAGCTTPTVKGGPATFAYTTDFERTRTEDGWTLSIRRFKPQSTDPTRAPVVLCHGLNCNDRFFDISEEVSLARYLAGRGYDVWVPALRGAGGSTKPGINWLRRQLRPVIPELPRELTFPSIDPTKLDWTMDDYIIYDVPTILRTVREQTGAPQVHWVGHSLGGVIIYAYVGRFGNEGLASIVSLGVPLTIPQPPNNFLAAFRDNKELFKLITLLVNASIPASLRRLDQRSGVAAALYNPRHVDRPVLREFFTRGVEDIPVGVLDQLVKAVETGEMRSADDETRYAGLLDQVTVPCFVTGGLVDLIAPPEAIRYVYHHISSQDKAFHIFALVNNDSIDYGHLDLIIGRYAPRDVFPAIADWLAHHPQDAAAATAPGEVGEPKVELRTR